VVSHDIACSACCRQIGTNRISFCNVQREQGEVVALVTAALWSGIAAGVRVQLDPRLPRSASTQ